MQTMQRHKEQPRAAGEGYCLGRTRARLSGLIWALLFLIIGLGCGLVFLAEMAGDKTGWEINDYIRLAAAGVLGLGGVLASIYEAFVSLRDALFPGKSRLARSIRSQLSRSDESMSTRELFAMVDQDIRENGLWFDRVAVGKTWVLGDDVSAISRIRAVFDRDEVIHRHVNGRTQSSRVIELYILDDKKQVQMTGLRDPKELKALIECLKLRAPEAVFLPYSQYHVYCGKSEEEWQALDRDCRYRQAQREMRQERAEYAASQSNPDFVFTDLLGQRTSRFDRRMMREQKQAPDLSELFRWQRLSGPGQTRQQVHFRLSYQDSTGASRAFERFTRRDVELAGEGLSDGKYRIVMLYAGPRYLFLAAGDKMDGRVTANACRPEGGVLRVYETKCTDREARTWLLEMMDGVFDPDFSQWKDITKKREKNRKKYDTK